VEVLAQCLLVLMVRGRCGLTTLARRHGGEEEREDGSVAERDQEEEHVALVVGGEEYTPLGGEARVAQPLR
jgi:hypothetical protein